MKGLKQNVVHFKQECIELGVIQGFLYFAEIRGSLEFIDKIQGFS